MKSPPRTRPTRLAAALLFALLGLPISCGDPPDSGPGSAGPEGQEETVSPGPAEAEEAEGGRDATRLFSGTLREGQPGEPQGAPISEGTFVAIPSVAMNALLAENEIDGRDASYADVDFDVTLASVRSEAAEYSGVDGRGRFALDLPKTGSPFLVCYVPSEDLKTVRGPKSKESRALSTNREEIREEEIEIAGCFRTGARAEETGAGEEGIMSGTESDRRPVFLFGELGLRKAL